MQPLGPFSRLWLAPAIIALLALIAAVLFQFFVGFDVADRAGTWLGVLVIVLNLAVYYYLGLGATCLIGRRYTLKPAPRAVLPFVLALLVFAIAYGFAEEKMEPVGPHVFKKPTLTGRLKSPGRFVTNRWVSKILNPSAREKEKKFSEWSSYVEAVRRGDLERVKEIPQNLVDGAFDGRYFSLVIYAARAKNLDVVKVLVEKGAKLDSRSQILANAARYSNPEIVRYLIEKGAEPLLGQDWKEYTSTGKLDINECLELPIVQAAQSKRWDTFEPLLNEGERRSQGRLSKYLLKCAKTYHVDGLSEHLRKP